MESPNMPSISIDPPQSGERRRRGRAVDVMSHSMPTPERPQHHHLPTPVTQRRRPSALAPSSHTGVQLPTPQTLPRNKRASPRTDDPTSPSGHTQFFFAQSGAEPAERVPPRRRPGLMFAQQMGLTQTAATSDMKFGARLGIGGVMRSAHGPVDKVVTRVDNEDNNPFLVRPSTSRTAIASPSFSSRPAPSAPGSDTSYVPQALRPSEDRSLSPHPRRRPRTLSGGADDAETVAAAQRRQMMMDEDNPFIAKPGEVVRPRPTREEGQHVTYVFRGAKKIFANPFFPPETSYAPSELDPSHPDFDPHPCPQPRLLFPTPVEPAEPTTPPQAKRMAGFGSMDVDHGPLHDDDDDLPDLGSETPDLGSESESDEEELPARRGMLFGPGAMKRDREPSGFEARKRARA